MEKRREKINCFTEIIKRRKRQRMLKIIVILAVLICLILAAVGYYFYSKGFRFWFDANPSPSQVKKWTIEKFNPTEYQIWNANPEFDDYEFDTGILENSTAMFLRKDKNHTWNLRNLACGKEAVIIAPKEFEKGGWGVMIYGWKINGTQEFEPNAARIVSKNGIYKIYVKMNKDGLYGNGTAIQGWLWDKPENTPWHSPFPLLIKNKEIVLRFKVKINKAETDNEKLNYDWQMFSVSTFLTSPKLSKPLVIDLAFYVNRSVMWSRESNEDYHYQRLIVPSRNKKDAFGKWKTYTVDYSWFVKDALKRFNIEYATNTLQLESVEILSETMYGEAEFEIDNLYLYYRSRQNAVSPTESANNAE
jgi:hypothetical protein